MVSLGVGVVRLVTLALAVQDHIEILAPNTFMALPDLAEVAAEAAQDAEVAA